MRRKSDRPEIMAAWTSVLHGKFETGSRHRGTVSVTVGALKEARAGDLDAQAVVDTLQPMFVTAATARADRRGGSANGEAGVR